MGRRRGRRRRMNAPIGPMTARGVAERAQRIASDPGLSAWVGASAGSGKTKVLTDRVLRLLLQEDQKANRLLCLTFTRAAAAEMATRLARRLGDWAVAEEPKLDAELAALGAVPGEALRRRARSLFAEVLELPGGMRISTIHAFCQSLLHAFPLKAGRPPQFRVLEDMDAAQLLAEARESVLSGNQVAPAKVALLAGLVGADDFSKSVAGLMRERGRLAATLRATNGIPGLRLRMARLLGVEDEDTVETALAGLCAVPEAVGQAAAALLNHKNKTSRDGAARMRAWLAQDPADRDPAEWRSCLFTDKGDLRKALEGIPEIEREATRLEAAESHLTSCRLLEATEALLALAGPV